MKKIINGEILEKVFVSCWLENYSYFIGDILSRIPMIIPSHVKIYGNKVEYFLASLGSPNKDLQVSSKWVDSSWFQWRNNLDDILAKDQKAPDEVDKWRKGKGASWGWSPHHHLKKLMREAWWQHSLINVMHGSHISYYFSMMYSVLRLMKVGKAGEKVLSTQNLWVMMVSNS